MQKLTKPKRYFKIASILLLAASNIGLCADIHIVVGKAISESSQLAISQLTKCGMSGETTSSSDQKISSPKITRLYYSIEARVFIEVVTSEGVVNRIMWQRFDPDDHSLGDSDFTSASEVRINGRDFTSTSQTAKKENQEAEQAAPRNR